jgi:N-methylhydantoinase A
LEQAQGATRYRVGIDIGGTFTDLIMVDERGQITARKLPSTPGDYSRAVLDGLEMILASLDEQAPGYSVLPELVHGTTVATNAVLEQRGARTALITTAGFRDVLELRRLRVPQLYNLQWEKPPPLADRFLRLEVDERIQHDGRILRPLDPDQVRQHAATLASEAVESIAVCLINSYVNPIHEQQIGEILAGLLPDFPVSLSTDIIREIGEFERTSTTVTNAYVKPIVARYLTLLDAELKRRGFNGRLLVMQSNGAVMTIEAARQRPCYLIESGPAAGVIAGRAVAEDVGCGNVITLDMGGTTAKAAMIEQGEIAFVDEYEIGGGFTVGSRLMKGGGYLLRIPAIDLAEISAGGGSIAWIDSGGALQVGPHSAGADPGPACYDLGNDQPTITDANVVLGYIDPHEFASGMVTLKPERAWRAVECLGRELSMDAREAAFAVHVLGNVRMGRAIRAISTERGRDVRDYALIAYGGSGPIHAAQVAKSLGMERVIIPPYPGLLSALGLIVAQAGHQFVRTFRARLDELLGERLLEAVREMEQAATAELATLSYPLDRLAFSFEADMRYVGQFFRVRVPVATGDGSGPDGIVSRLASSFEAEHQRRYRHRVEGEPIEIVSLQMTAIDKSSDTTTWLTARYGKQASRATVSSTREKRDVYFSREQGAVETPVYSRAELDAPMTGPMLIKEFDTTIVVPPDAHVSRDRSGNVTIDLKA